MMDLVEFHGKGSGMIVRTEYKKLSRPFNTEQGGEIKEPVAAYEEYGTKDGPVILITHGGISSHHAAGKYHPDDPLPGFWDAVIGPGKPIDTNRFRILSANSLGSMYGSSSPLSLNPDTGKHYGPDFPKITLIDMTRFLRVFLEEMGVDRLFMIAGPSMGALQALQMAVLFPDFVGSAVTAAVSGRMTPYGMCMHHFMIHALQMDPEFNNGWYQIGKPTLMMRSIHQMVRVYYTSEKIIKQLFWDMVPEGKGSQEKRCQNIKNYLLEGLEEHIKGRDPNCYITILNALNSYDLGRDVDGNYEKGVERIKCPVLLMNISTDSEFPPYWAQEVADILNRKQPGQARMHVIGSPWGHLGCIQEGLKLGKHISQFMDELI